MDDSSVKLNQTAAQDEAAELRELELSSKSRFFKRLVTFYRAILSMHFLQIREATFNKLQHNQTSNRSYEINEDHHIIDGKVLSSSLMILWDAKKIKLKHLLVQSLYLLSLFMFIRNLFIFLILARQGYIWHKYNVIYSGIKEESQNVSSCRPWQARNWKGYHVQEWNNLNYYLKILKAAYSSNNAIVIIAYNALIITSLTSLIIGCIYFHRRPLKIDYLSFLFDPKAVRSKLREDISEMISGLSRLIRANIYDHLIYHSLKMQFNEDTQIYGSYENIPRATLPINMNFHDRIRARESKELSYNKVEPLVEQSITLIDCLNKINNRNLVIPSNLTSSWHRILSRLVYYVNLLVYSGVCLSHFNFVIVLIISDLYSIVQNRCHLIRCFGLIANSTNETYIQLIEDMDSLDSREIEIYRHHNVTDFIGNSRLIFEYELKHYMNNQDEWLAVTLFSVTYVYSSCGFVLLYMIYLLGVIDKLRWLRQIKMQVGEIIANVDNNIYHNYENNCSNEHKTKEYLGKTSPPENETTSLLINMMVTYLNYSLFISRHRIFKEYGDFVLAISSLVFGSLFVTSYYSNSYIEMKWLGFFVFTNFMLVLLTNLTWLLAAMLFERILDINRQLHKLMALSIQARLELSLPLQLFRQQLLEERDTTTMFAQRTFIGHTTMSGIFSLNAYLMAFWILVFKY